MKKLYILSGLVGALLIGNSAIAQNMYVSTNLLDYLNLGTINGEFGLSPLPRWSFYARGRYNPFTINIGRQMQNRVAGGALGVKYWFWYTNSGWFMDSHLGASVYNTGGIFDSYSYEGRAYSLSVGGGYSFLLHKNWNLDFGIGVQGGYTSFVKYACPRCGKVMGGDKKAFIAPSNMLVQLTLLL